MDLLTIVTATVPTSPTPPVVAAGHSPAPSAILRPMLVRASRRWDMLRVAASSLGLAIGLLAAAYTFGAIDSGATTGGIVAAFVAVAIAGSGLLYAWRLGAGGLAD